MSDAVPNNELVTVKTRDGINLTGIPRSLLETDEEFLKAYVQRLRETSGPGDYVFNDTTPSQETLGYPEIPEDTPQPRVGAIRAPVVPSQEASKYPETPEGMPQPRVGAISAPTVPPSRVEEPPPVTSAEQPAPEARTDIGGLLGGAVRGAGPTAMGAAAGAALGAPFAGIGAIPGAAIGAAAGGLTQMVGDPIVSLVNRVLGTNYTLPTDALGDLFTKLGVASPDTAAERVVQAAAQGVAGAAGSVGLGQVMQSGQTAAQGLATVPTRAHTVGSTLADSPIAQYGGGLGSAAASQGAEELGAGPLVQTGAGLVGGIAGAGLSNINLARSAPPPIDEAASAGVRVLTSDVRPPRTFVGRWARQLGERIPVTGTSGLRSAQQVERVAAMRSLVRQYGADDIAGLSDDIVDNLITVRKGKITALTSVKDEVIEQLVDTDIAVNVDSTLDIVNGQIARLNDISPSGEFAPIIRHLENFAQDITDQPLGNIEALRSQLGETLGAANLVHVKSMAERVTASVYGAVRNDMHEYIQQYGGDAALTKWVTANNRLSEMMDDLAIPALKRVIEKGEATPEIMDNLLFNRNRSDTVRMYHALDDEGQALTRTAIIARAAGRSGDDPDIFVREVKRLGDQTGVFFHGRDAAELEGLMRVFEVTKRAGAANRGGPATKMAMGVIPLSAAGLGTYFGGGIQGFAAVVGGGAAYGIAARAYESAAVRNILMAIPRVTAGSTQEAALLRRLLDTVRAVEATQEAPERPEQVNEEEAQLIRG